MNNDCIQRKRIDKFSSFFFHSAKLFRIKINFENFPTALLSISCNVENHNKKENKTNTYIVYTHASLINELSPK